MEPAMSERVPARTGGGGAGRARLAGLDGIRGLAALFVVLHHCYLLSYPGFPVDNGPPWLGWMMYGHFAVGVFIVLSGFSLAVAPARNGWRLGGVKRFAHRRLWRILPPYWPALAMSLIIAWTLVPQPGESAPTAKSVLVYGLLLQDVIGSPSPNGALWSIAVEAQLYLVFPLLLLVVRRAGAVVMLAAVTVVVAAVGALSASVAAIDALMRLTPQFAALFAVGVVAAGIVSAGDRVRNLPWHWLALLAFLPVLALILVNGSVWTVGNFFWVDLAIGPSVGMLLAAVATGRPRRLVRLLDSRPVRGLGSFSYSLYLTHAPLVVAVSALVVVPITEPGGGRLAATLGLALPLTLVVARLFAAVFELPFQRHRTWPALRDAMVAAVRARGRKRSIQETDLDEEGERSAVGRSA
ncbi:acyltransferase [Spongiactinospora sp. TRM90649]|uniref:acyltransferase family protein n=1 Tax=Spongiactinospora sp. TRM90649 TaxID=3031114 RepID=UPI0023F6F492|nr:acyltransferase [Spongiactinospora sp. TRM90649]MDF5755012.1 acyltransferase [Spongiactinospora sp. TRM90649]